MSHSRACDECATALANSILTFVHPEFVCAITYINDHNEKL